MNGNPNGNGNDKTDNRPHVEIIPSNDPNVIESYRFPDGTIVEVPNLNGPAYTAGTTVTPTVPTPVISEAVTPVSPSASEVVNPTEIAQSVPTPVTPVTPVMAEPISSAPVQDNVVSPITTTTTPITEQTPAVSLDNMTFEQLQQKHDELGRELDALVADARETLANSVTNENSNTEQITNDSQTLEPIKDAEKVSLLTEEESLELAKIRNELDNADYNDMYLRPEYYQELQNRLAVLEAKENGIAPVQEVIPLTDQEIAEMTALRNELDNADYNDMYLRPEYYQAKQDRLKELEKRHEASLNDVHQDNKDSVVPNVAAQSTTAVPIIEQPVQLTSVAPVVEQPVQSAPVYSSPVQESVIPTIQPEQVQQTPAAPIVEQPVQSAPVYSAPVQESVIPTSQPEQVQQTPVAPIVEQPVQSAPVYSSPVQESVIPTIQPEQVQQTPVVPAIEQPVQTVPVRTVTTNNNQPATTRIPVNAIPQQGSSVQDARLMPNQKGGARVQEEPKEETVHKVYGKVDGPLSSWLTPDTLPNVNNSKATSQRAAAGPVGSAKQTGSEKSNDDLVDNLKKYGNIQEFVQPVTPVVTSRPPRKTDAEITRDINLANAGLVPDHDMKQASESASFFAAQPDDKDATKAVLIGNQLLNKVKTGELDEPEWFKETRKEIEDTQRKKDEKAAAPLVGKPDTKKDEEDEDKKLIPVVVIKKPKSKLVEKLKEHKNVLKIITAVALIIAIAHSCSNNFINKVEKQPDPEPTPIVSEIKTPTPTPGPAIEEVTPDPEPEPTPGPVIEEVTPDPEPEPTPDPVIEEVTPDPEPEPTPDPVIEEVTPDPEPEPTPDPVIEEVTPDPEPEPTPGPIDNEPGFEIKQDPENDDIFKLRTEEDVPGGIYATTDADGVDISDDHILKAGLTEVLDGQGDVIETPSGEFVTTYDDGVDVRTADVETLDSTNSTITDSHGDVFYGNPEDGYDYAGSVGTLGETDLPDGTTAALVDPAEGVDRVDIPAEPTITAQVIDSVEEQQELGELGDGALAAALDIANALGPEGLPPAPPVDDIGMTEVEAGVYSNFAAAPGVDNPIPVDPPVIDPVYTEDYSGPTLGGK